MVFARVVRCDSLVQRRDDVQKANNGPIYWLGTAIGGFVHAQNISKEISALKDPALKMRGNLDNFVNRFGALSLSKKAAEDLIFLLDNIFFPKDGQGVPDVQIENDSLSPDQQQAVVTSIIRFQAVLPSELEEANVYYISGKRAYDMTILMENGQWLVSREVWEGLTWSRDKVWQDVREAAKCLALNIPTAVGFHFYRAVEAIIVDEYFPLFVIVNPKNRNLGKYIEILTTLGIDERITKELDHLRECYRNPISHPEVFWDQRQADIATNLAVAVIDLMGHDILARKTEYFLRKEES